MLGEGRGKQPKGGMTGTALHLVDRGVRNLQPQRMTPMKEKPTRDLRRRMLEDMAMRKFEPAAASVVAAPSGRSG